MVHGLRQGETKATHLPLTKMEWISKGVRLWLLFLLCPATIGASGMCSGLYSWFKPPNDPFYNIDYLDDPYFDSRYMELYRKLEEALLNNKTLLEELRTGFISKGDVPICFWVKLELMNGTDVKCGDYLDPTFCRDASTPGSPWHFVIHQINI